MNEAAGSDFNPGPEAFTNACAGYPGHETQVDPVVPGVPGTGEKTNDSGDAIASDRTRGGTPQDV